MDAAASVLQPPRIEFFSHFGPFEIHIPKMIPGKFYFHFWPFLSRQKARRDLELKSHQDTR